MRGQLLFLALVAAAMAVLTWVMGWWGIVLAAVVVGFAFRDQGGGGWRVALAAALSWTALLLVDVMSGPFARLAHTLGGVIRVPAFALIAVTLLFAAALAWSAATVAAVLGVRLSARSAAGPA
jgi:hypothetical protein